MFKRTRISRISRTKGRDSQTMRDEYFLIRGEYHEFYHPDGMRAIAFATFGLYAISKEKPIRIDLRDLQFVFSKTHR